MADLNLSAQVRAERAKYPTVLTEDQPAKILNAVAWANRADGWGLSVKPHGNHVLSPQGVFVAYDILHHKPTNKLFGCFTNELRADVNWGEEPYHGDPVGRPWLAPIDPGASVPAPTPTPQPPSNLPTLDQWIHGEYPQLVAAYMSRHDGNEPSHEWAAFQTCRRGGVMLAPGEAAWSFAKMVAHELAQ